MDKKISFLNIKINSLTKKEISGILLEFAKGEKIKTAFYLNAHCVNLACCDKEYRMILNKSDLVYAGGKGVVWAAGFLGIPLPERINILDFFDILVPQLKENKITIYLLGATNDVVRKAREKLERLGLIILGARSGFFNKAEETGIIREINGLKPDILMIGIGAPAQEKWIYSHLNELDVNLCWGVGGVFKIFAGELKKTPVWISRCGMEWLYLGLQDPKRLVGRYLIGNIIFIFRILNHKL